MSADFLLELRCEEIPARMQAKASEDLARLFTERLAEAGLKAESLTSYVTPRRLALIAHGLPLHTQAVSEEHKGPRTTAPEQALEGFLRKTGLTKDQLEDRDGIWFAVVEKPGRATADVLAERLPLIVWQFPWPKSMRWGGASNSTESLRWVRPLNGVVAILGEQTLEIDFDVAHIYANSTGDIAVRKGEAGLVSNNITYGHRFHSSGPINITSAATYAEQLRACHVIVDQEERKAIIESRAKALAADAGYELIEDAGLVAENAGLTEWPVPLLGYFDPIFLEVPPEVIQLTLRINQKYFVLRDGAGKLAPAFICTANVDAKDGGAAIVAGNGKVLAARLSDARFFWEQDKKTKLADQVQKLSRITFHEKLGTVADKVERVAKLAEWLATEDIVPNCDPTLARQAAELCKADLVTEMVGEFPELQGLMGGYYARAEGLPDAVADAIRDHYKPVGQGDEVPTAPVTVAVCLADKLDTIACFFAWEMLPTGSKDPFVLRRASMAIIAIIERTQIRLPLTEAVRKSGWHTIWSRCHEDEQFLSAFLLRHFDKETIEQEHFGDWFERSEDGVWNYAKMDAGTWLSSLVLDFFADRLKVQQKEAGVRHDLIDAVFTLGGEDDLVRLLARVHALQSFIETPDGSNLLAGYKRAANILKKEEFDASVVPTQPCEPAEIALAVALDAAEPRASAAIEAEDFEGAMSALTSLRAPIDAFFESVIVNDPEPAKRAARLALLERVRTAVHKVADFSRITG